MEILLSNRQKIIRIDTEDLKKKAKQLLKDLDCNPDSTLSISLVDSEEMADLNFRYRGKTGPTNVLSFAQHEGDHISPYSALLGDVVICADRVANDSVELGYTEDEMALYLLIHGIFHLMGHDHDQPDQASKMAQLVEDTFQRFTS